MRSLARNIALTAAVLGSTSCNLPMLHEANVPVDIVIAATTDVHGYLRGWDYYANAPDTLRGLTRVATIVDSLRRVSRIWPVLVDAGDFLQGNPLTFAAARIDTTMPHPVVAAMNAMRYDAGVIGNHEFNYGLPTLDRILRQTRFPVLAANVFTPDGEPKFRPWVFTVRYGTIKIALIGATTPGSMVWDRENLAGRVEVRDPIPSVREAVRDARDAGAAITVVVIHSGLDEPSSYDTVATKVPSENVAARLAREVPGIDLIVYGHSHKEVRETVIGSTLLMQPKNWATSVAVAHLMVQRQNGRWHVTSKHASLVQAAHHKENAEVLGVSEEGHRAAERYARTAVGSTTLPWRADSARVIDSPLTDFILEVERSATGAELASTPMFSLDANIAPGPITVARIAALYPYDNTLRVVRINGAQLRAYLEQSARYFKSTTLGAEVDPSIPGFNYDMVAGVDYTIDVSKPIGERITRLDYQGRPVTPTDTFTLALNNYRQTGGGGYSMLRDAPVVQDRGLEIRQLLIDEVRKRGTIKPTDYFHQNWRIVPSSAIPGLLKTLK
jgi:2',3'-cyclic-nucleotide 2'-phosphodiesterase (5'-nucleotidase family)